mgnify:FL=1
MERFNHLKTQAAGLKATMDGLAEEGKHLKRHCQGLEDRSRLIGTVPCGGMDIAQSCPLLRDAHAAATDLPGATKTLDDKRAAWAQSCQDLEAINAQQKEAVAGADALAKAEQAARDIAQRIRDNAAILALEPTIAQADGIIQAAQATIEEAEAAILDKTRSMTAATNDCAARVAAVEQRYAAEKAEADTERARILAELAALPPKADTAALEQAEKDATQAEGVLARAEQALSGINVRIGAAKERRSQLEKQAAGLATVRARAAHLETEIGHWSALAKAFGNDGIIALSIDDAGPTLAAFANDLLLSCYGPRFSVSIRTQAETAKGDLKETFDIVVFDGDRGDEKGVRDMSGGERIWVNEALTRAIGLYQGQMHGRHYECLFADESDGALDPERKAQFMRMKRKVLELGGYQQEIFISHTPELWEMADAVIDMKEFMA